MPACEAYAGFNSRHSKIIMQNNKTFYVSIVVAIVVGGAGFFIVPRLSSKDTEFFSVIGCIPRGRDITEHEEDRLRVDGLGIIMTLRDDEIDPEGSYAETLKYSTPYWRAEVDFSLMSVQGKKCSPYAESLLESPLDTLDMTQKQRTAFQKFIEQKTKQVKQNSTKK